MWEKAIFKNYFGNEHCQAFWKSNSVVFRKFAQQLHICVGSPIETLTTYKQTIAVCFPLLVGTYDNLNHNKSIFPLCLHFTQNVPRKCNIWSPTSFIFKAILQFWEHVKLIIFTLLLPVVWLPVPIVGSVSDKFSNDEHSHTCLGW